MYSAAHLILRRIEDAGYAVGFYQGGGTEHANSPRTAVGFVELRAVRLNDPDEQHVARCGGGTGHAQVFEAAMALAEMVGLDRVAARGKPPYHVPGSSATSAARSVNS